jgi:hypothetical protein
MLVNAINWRRSNAEYLIEWGGGDWTLDAADDALGLRPTDGATGRLLTLSGLAATGRRADDAFRADGLVGVELHHSRLMATYEPRGWNGLTIRAAWGPSPDGEGLDLEVQASTSTVGELKRLEVLVQSTWIEPSKAGTATIVEPRDRGAALLSYDGRLPAEVLQGLTTGPVPASEDAAFAPIIASAGGTGSYLEMVHPQDASRRLVVTTEDGSAIAWARYALFGYDLEKGVVLRGRLRGVWLPEGEADRAALSELRRRFVDEPPPLGN